MSARNLSALALVVTAAPLFGGCGGPEAEPETVLRPVRIQQVFSTGGRRVRTFSGIARSGLESRLSFKVPGTVRRIPVTVGDTVLARGESSPRPESVACIRR